MKPQHLAFIVLVFVLALCLPVAAGAQGPLPPTYVSPAPDAFPAGDEVRPFLERQTVAGSLASPATPDIAIGQPGLSFRYMQTFGETEVAYLADTGHINFPYGIATDGANVWIGELFGHRALKFTSTGTFVSAIGTAGSATNPFWEVADLAVDSGGNTWIASGDQVIKFDAGGNEVSRLWRDDDSNTHLSYALGIAFDSAGNIYVSDGAPWWSRDQGNQRIQVFDPAGAYITTIGTTGAAGSGNLQFHGPHHITIYDNVLYVADGGNHRVQIFNVANASAPAYVGTIGVTGESGGDNAHLGNPSGVAVDANYIYVADRWHNRVQIFARSNRTYVATLGTWGSGNGEFWEPTDVAVDTLGNLYVADFVNTRVQQFDKNRTYVRTYGVARVPYLTDDTHYNNPSGVAAAADGSLYIAEDNGHRLVKLNAAGQPLWTVGVPGLKGDWDDAPDKLDNPVDVALNAAGRVYVADRWHGRVQIFNPDGSYYATLDNGGTADNQVGCPTGVGLAPDGYLYVTDPCSQRVQIFDRNLLYVASMGTAGEAGSDNTHFDEPEDVAVDSRGMIYVSDRNNHRVQVFNASRAYVRTIGETSVGGNDFEHLNGPNGLTVDAADRLYIADAWNSRVQVFDANGAYLTTIGGSWGTRTGQTRSAEGVAVAANGDVFVADSGNHRIQKFAAGVPGWRQANINGFGRIWNSIILSLASFGERLYAGAYDNSGKGAQIWRMDKAGDWQQVMNGGFGDPTNAGIDHLIEFKGSLYAGTWNANPETSSSNGGQVWRSADGKNWDKVVDAGFGDPANGEVYRFAVFGDQVYAGTWSDTTIHGGEIWRSSTGDSGSWARVVSNGFNGDSNNASNALEVFHGFLYAGTDNALTGGEVWRSSDGIAWNQVNADGFGTPDNRAISALAPFNGYLYASTYTKPGTGGAQVWRCQVCDGSDWAEVIASGLGDANTRLSSALEAANGQLYFVVGNVATGMEVWRTATGNAGAWEQVGFAGFGDSNNRGPYWDNSVAVFDNRLHIGTSNYANGGEIWVKTLTADFTATPTRGAPPLAVQFTNTSAGDFTLSQWDFGDGSWSEAKNPAHLYTAAGTYTVSLRVSAGMESSTVTKVAYIDVHQRVFLPLVLRNYDPLLYDLDFGQREFDSDVTELSHVP